MTKMRYLMLGAASAMIAGASPAFAADAPVTPARTPVWACDITGFWELPGTDICFKVGGYVKADMTYTTEDFNSQDFDVVFGLRSAALGGSSVPNEQVRLHANQSRFNFDARSNTEYGTVRAFIEGDFEGGGGNQRVSNSAHFRLRHAFVQFGNLLAGQTWTTFMILSGLPDTLDFNGPGGLSFLRQAQIRWTQPLGNGVSFAIALENPENLDSNRGTATMPGDEIPDLVGKITVSQSWGSISVVGVVRDLQADNAIAVQSDEVGWAVSVGGRFVLPVANGKDNLRWTAIYSDGGSRYMIDANLIGLANFGTIGSAERNALGNPVESWGANVSFQHFWSNQVRSNFVASYVKMDNLITAAASESTQYYAANVIWSPVPRVEFGVEVIHGRHELVSGASANATRVQVSAKRAF